MDSHQRPASPHSDPAVDEKVTGEIDSKSPAAYTTYDFQDYTAVENSRVRWKIDLIVLPCIVIAMTLAFLDKNALSYAAIWGLRDDADLHGQQYSWLATIFYFGYLAMEFPTLYILSKVKIGKYIGSLVAVWGLVSICMAAGTNFPGLAAVRFFLGVLEAGLLPCFMVLNAMWWRREEQPLRTAFWFNTFAGVFGGILSYAIGKGVHGALSTWRYLFIIYGAVTTLVGITIFFVLPDEPSTAWFLTAREKQVAQARTIANQTGRDTRGDIKWNQIIEALQDPKYWTCVVLAITQPITNAGVSNFNPLIISQFGFSTARTTLLATPQAAVAMIVQISLTLLAFKVKNIRSILWFLSALPAMIGSVLLMTLDPVSQQSGCLVGIYMMGCYNVPWVFAVSLATTNTSGKTKKSFTSVTFAVCYAVGNIIGPQFFLGSESPTYPTGIRTMCACFCFMAVTGAVYGLLCVHENRSRDRQHAPTAEDLLQAGEALDNPDDLTDGENKLFRYTY